MFCAQLLPHCLRQAFFAALWLCSLLLPPLGNAQPAQIPKAGEVTLQAKYWIDETGTAGIEQISVAPPERFQPLTSHRSFQLTKQSALWMRLDLPASSNKARWFLQLSSGTFFDRANLYQRSQAGAWAEQKAGDHLPVAQWDHPDQIPVFQLDLSAASTVWLRLENQPAAIAPRLQLISEESLASQRRWAALLLGGYFGFGLLVLFLGIMHVRLYGDRAFVAYSAYVAFMLLFQLAFTGIGGLYFWPHWAAWNNAAPALFMLLLTSSGIWFVREASVLARHQKTIDKAVMAWVSFGVMFAFIYVLWANRTTFLLLNLFGLLSVLLSIGLCLWVWRRGEKYGFWLFVGFLPVHLGYPFPALRSSGLIADSWLSKYAVLIGSAIEIPLLLYVLHMRAKEFSENRARVRAIDQTDALTGLAITPVLTLRARDALRRNRRHKQTHALLLVELANHAEILNTAGRPAADRALVVAASCLLSAVTDLDTVCRIDDSHFAILIESSSDASVTKLVAQRIVARGLSEQSRSLENNPLRFRVVTSPLISAAQYNDRGRDIELNELLLPLFHGMVDLAKEPKKAILHLQLMPTASISPTSLVKPAS
jgi:two-component system, sensor histidine kinase LadS